VEERTLVLIKPDAIEKDVWFEIIQIYLNEGLNVCKARILRMNKSLAAEFYKEHEWRSYFQELVRHMSSGPIVALIISGENAIDRVRELNGATTPAEAKEGTVRRLYGEPDSGPKNAVHGSDSKENAEREIMIIFE